MFIKKTKQQQEQLEQTVSSDELFERFRNFVNGLSSSAWKARAVGAGVISVLLIAASSFLFVFTGNQWIATAVGSPAGFLIFLLGLGIVYRSGSEWGITKIRENRSFRSRLKIVATLFIIFALVFIPLGNYIPYGLGGTILIVITLSALTIARRTPYELALVAQGVPDPRDLGDADDDEELVVRTEPIVDPTQEVSGRIK